MRVGVALSASAQRGTVREWALEAQRGSGCGTSCAGRRSLAGGLLCVSLSAVPISAGPADAHDERDEHPRVLQ